MTIDILIYYHPFFHAWQLLISINASYWSHLNNFPCGLVEWQSVHDHTKQQESKQKKVVELVV